ncbi:hypothetical protein HBI57_243480 [Parastagonospora nodorum]|nr:hypothetical protein HBI57_243480 [Parastagonospora nodorum]KAH6453157.1 hypothetical protein HBI58_206440 [Parastagonospora nodorum]
MAAAKSLEMRTTPPAKQNPATNPEDIDLEVYRAAITLFSMRAAEEYVILDKSSVGTAMANPNLLSMQEDKRIRNDASLGSKNFGAFMAATTIRLEHPVPNPSMFSSLRLGSGSNRDARSSLSPTFRVGMSHLSTTPLSSPEQSPTAKPHAAMESTDAPSLADDEASDELNTLLGLEPVSTTVSKKRKHSSSTLPDSPCAKRRYRNRTRLWPRD